MHKPEFVQEKEMHKILWDLETETDHPISTRNPHLVSINKGKKGIVISWILPFQRITE